MRTIIVQTLNRQLVNGRVQQAHGQDRQAVTSAITGEQIAEGVLGDATDANLAVEAARQALPAWSATTLDQRREYLQKLADSFAARREEMIDALVEEFGTTTATAAYIVDQSRDWFVYAQKLLIEDTFTEQVGRATVHKVPVGVAVLITPWNGASWFIAMKASVALAAGCTIVIKPSERGIWQAQPVLDAFADAGLPDGVVNVVFGKGDPVGNILTAHPDVAKVSITGSTATGKIIAHNGVDTMKRVTLELGGKSPTIILDDADLSHAVPFAVQAGLFNNGQACIAGTRILIPHSREQEIKQALADAVAAMKVGDPRDPDTIVGPVLDRDQYDRVQHYIQAGVDEGGQILVGGLGHPEGLADGNYVKPTLLTATNDQTIAREEIFGPVLAVITYRDEDDAIAIANNTPYGLHAYVATGDVQRGQRVARRIQAGRLMINEIVDAPDAPFGGFKQSGLGREFGHHGLAAYLETQAVFS
ncbi:aldehyde dehydrogenase family protein [Saccharopolyspora sp. K220]|uniref:aldehyde dehydrogenase family protein n=1 Tax=Saccharopolyspora soli TaxID=2926618 RepID=UPI001F577981|nr:aldehyde dehydrogenase family protein [Saccharopolyspora soli]MCI2421378.1 aldehyde dehydrogenase family protein [Saccharopolyspora soli]